MKKREGEGEGERESKMNAVTLQCCAALPCHMLFYFLSSRSSAEGTIRNGRGRGCGWGRADPTRRGGGHVRMKTARRRDLGRPDATVSWKSRRARDRTPFSISRIADECSAFVSSRLLGQLGPPPPYPHFSLFFFSLCSVNES